MLPLASFQSSRHSTPTMSDEAGLPKATVNKVIKDCLPSDLKIAAEVRDLVADASLGKYTL